MNIDLVIAYVDNQDPVWRKQFIDFCRQRNMNQKICELAGDRYQDIGLINYQLKLVEKNMPWINKIYLLLSNIEQAPKNLSDKVQIVLHKDFIFNEYLPTFNSTTIEMFLWNIKDLSEYFIYANDDMLPTKELSEKDFFEIGMIKINFKSDYLRNENVFRSQCYNSYQHVAKALNMSAEQYFYMVPYHSFTPMIKSHCKECFNLIKNDILRNIWAFRTTKQHNQYIFPIYEYLKYGVIPTQIDFCYTELKEDVNLNHQIVCINKICNNNNAKILISELNKLI